MWMPLNHFGCRLIISKHPLLFGWKEIKNQSHLCKLVINIHVHFFVFSKHFLTIYIIGNFLIIWVLWFLMKMLVLYFLDVNSATLCTRHNYSYLLFFSQKKTLLYTVMVDPKAYNLFVGAMLFNILSVFLFFSIYLYFVFILVIVWFRVQLTEK